MQVPNLLKTGAGLGKINVELHLKYGLSKLFQLAPG